MQGLRLAFDHMIGSRFEDMVREADVAETLAAAGSPPPTGTRKTSGGAVQTAEMTLLRRPAVSTLAIVWDSPQVRGLTRQLCSKWGPSWRECRDA